LSETEKAALASRAAFHAVFGLDAERRETYYRILSQWATTYYGEPDTSKLPVQVSPRDLRNPAMGPPPNGTTQGVDLGYTFLRVLRQDANGKGPRRTFWRVDNVRLPCIIKATARLTEGSGGDAWVSLFVRDGVERAVKVASSQDYIIEEKSIDEDDHLTNKKEYPHRAGRKTPDFNTVAWVILRAGTTGNFMTEVYLNGLYLGSGELPFRDNRADLRLNVTNFEGDVAAKSEWESIAVWQAEGVQSIAARVKDAITKGKLPADK
jgi:hypothetical protein